MTAMAAAVQMEVAVAMAAPMPRVRVKCLGMTPEPDHGEQSARAARARARAAVAERHKAELMAKGFAELGQQMEQALNSPSTPAVIAELHQLRQECGRVELQWHQGAADGEMMAAAKVAAAAEDTTM